MAIYNLTVCIFGIFAFAICVGWDKYRSGMTLKRPKAVLTTFPMMLSRVGREEQI
jgi:hypothetical protein